MLKRYIIIASLILSYAVVFSHSVIPHHHHDHHQISENEKNQHHHHDDDEDNDEGLSHQFAKYFHSGTTSDFHEPNSKTYCDHFLIETLITFFQFDPEINEPPLLPHRRESIPISNPCLFVKGLRAPPSLIG
jgi:hypothetical protein